MVTAEAIRKAADKLRLQNGGEGPILGFSFDGHSGGVTIDYDEKRDITEMCLEALAEAINEAGLNLPERPALTIVRQG